LNEHRLALAIGLGVVCILLAITLDPLSVNWATTILVILAVGVVGLWFLRSRMGPPALAAPGMVPALAGAGAAPAGIAELAGPDVVRARPGRQPAADDARAELVALAGELPADDVRILRRVAVALRESG
jgi:hypothetical protein